MPWRSPWSCDIVEEQALRSERDFFFPAEGEGGGEEGEQGRGRGREWQRRAPLRPASFSSSRFWRWREPTPTPATVMLSGMPHRFSVCQCIVCDRCSGSCSRGPGEPLQLLEQPGAARRLVRRRRRPLRRRVDGRLLLRHRRHLTVKTLFARSLANSELCTHEDDKIFCHVLFLL